MNEVITAKQAQNISLVAGEEAFKESIFLQIKMAALRAERYTVVARPSHVTPKSASMIEVILTAWGFCVEAYDNCWVVSWHATPPLVEKNL